MTRPLLPSDFRVARSLAARIVDGLPDAIDAVGDAAPETHRFLRRQWFAAALAAYGGASRTLLVEAEGAPLLALPLVDRGPRILGLAALPGSYWPFRSFTAAVSADASVYASAVKGLGAWRIVRIGPVYDDDPAVTGLIAAARSAGWTIADRVVAQSFLLDMAAERANGAWPRNSTLRKNRFHEKHLAAHGALDWRMLDDDDWPAAFDTLAEVERASWHGGASDPKFAQPPHATFWREAARDPAIAGMFHAALLTVDGAPAAFSFDIDAGALRYAIANSYAPAYAKHSPGKLLYYRNLVDGLARGIDRVDWGAGDSGYKQVIGATPGPMIRDWLIVRPGPIGPLIARLWRSSGRRD